MATKPRPTLASAQGEDGLEKCKQWISIPTINPYTGKNISIGKNTYSQLQRICGQLGIQLCNNQTTPFMLSEISDMSSDDFIFYNDPNNGFTYCFEPADIDGLLQNPQNPWTRAPLSREFIQRLNLLNQNIQVPEVSPESTVLSINDMRTEIDRVLGLGYDDGSGPDPYVSVGQFLGVLSENIDILFPDTVDRNDPDTVIRFLYNNRFNKVSNKSFIYMIVKYALNKQALTLENIPPDEAQFMRSTSEAILSLIGSYPGIGASREIEEGDLMDGDSDDPCEYVQDYLLHDTVFIESSSVHLETTVTFNTVASRVIFEPKLRITLNNRAKIIELRYIQNIFTYTCDTVFNRYALIGNQYLNQRIYDCSTIVIHIENGNIEYFTHMIGARNYTRGELLHLIKIYMNQNHSILGIEGKKWNFDGLEFDTIDFRSGPYYKILLS